MKKWKNTDFFLALKSTNLFKIFIVFVAVYWIVAYLIFCIDPAFNSFGTAIWYCFELISTIVKILSACLSLFSIAVIAIVTITIVNYYHIALRRHEDAEMILMMKKLEHLHELSNEELKAISRQFQEWHS